MNVINICLYLYLLLKPFYLKTSGTIQISDVFIVIAFIITIIDVFKEKKKQENINLNQKILLLFLLCVIFINTVYYVIYSDFSFIKSTLYYIFLFIGVFTFSRKIKDYRFLRNYYNIFIIDIILQSLIYILGLGRYYEISRYMGTFNDPNQFGFFITLAIMYVYTLENILNIRKRAWYVYILSLILIIKSSSTGMILAIATFVIIQVICNSRKIFKSKKIFSILSIICLAIFILSTIGLLLYNNYNIKLQRENNTTDFQIKNRILEKINKLKIAGAILEDRHLDKLFDNTKYILYGAGEGKWNRFGDNNGEIHSTLPSILFCYGIIPTCILLAWIYSNIKGLKLKELSVYIAILVESFTLINHRQLLLWLIIILANLYKNENKLKINKGE